MTGVMWRARCNWSLYSCGMSTILINCILSSISYNSLGALYDKDVSFWWLAGLTTSDHYQTYSCSTSHVGLTKCAAFCSLQTFRLQACSGLHGTERCKALRLSSLLLRYTQREITHRSTSVLPPLSFAFELPRGGGNTIQRHPGRQAQLTPVNESLAIPSLLLPSCAPPSVSC